RAGPGRGAGSTPPCRSGETTGPPGPPGPPSNSPPPPPHERAVVQPASPVRAPIGRTRPSRGRTHGPPGSGDAPGHRRTRPPPPPPRAGGRPPRRAGTGANRPDPAVARADPRPARFGRRTGAPANRRPRASTVVQPASPAPALTGPDRRGEA